jgi:hypothetical protein
MVAPEQRRGKRGPGNEEGYDNASDTDASTGRESNEVKRVDRMDGRMKRVERWKSLSSLTVVWCSMSRIEISSSGEGGDIINSRENKYKRSKEEEIEQMYRRKNEEAPTQPNWLISMIDHLTDFPLYL